MLKNDNRIDVVSIALILYLAVFGCTFCILQYNGVVTEVLNWICMVICFIVVIYMQKGVKVDWMTALLAVTCVLHNFGRYPERTIEQTMLYTLTIILFTQMANFSFDREVLKGNTATSNRILWMMIIPIVYAIHIISVLINVWLFHIETLTTNRSADFFDIILDKVQNRNHCYVYTYMIFAVTIALLVDVKKHVKLTMFVFFLDLVILVGFQMAGARTPYLIIMVEVVVAFILYISYNRKDKALVTRFLKIMFITVGALLLIVGTFYFLFVSHIISFGDQIDSVIEWQLSRKGILGYRGNWWIEVLSKMPRYPFGAEGKGAYSFSPKNCHNMWVNMAETGGIIPFLCFMTYTCMAIRNLIIFVKQRSADKFLYFFLPCALAGFCVIGMLDAVPHLCWAHLGPVAWINIYISKYTKT